MSLSDVTVDERVRLPFFPCIELSRHSFRTKAPSRVSSMDSRRSSEARPKNSSQLINIQNAIQSCSSLIMQRRILLAHGLRSILCFLALLKHRFNSVRLPA